ncbi:MAG: type II toxin-antitoxin system VapC family toxin [Candidatus Acidiferrales bacterium]
MIVIDASLLVDVLLNTSVATRIAQRLSSSGSSLHVPHLVDVEIMHSLRRLVRIGKVHEARALEVLSDFADLDLTRYPHSPFLQRIWELRHNLSAYDAVYVALAEALDAPLLTRDVFLASAPAHDAKIELF